MTLAYEGNTDLAFSTDVLRSCGKDYSKVAADLRTVASKLDSSLNQLKSSGWTTPAGTAFYDMVDTGWKDNIEKYADLLDTLNGILEEAANSYEDLETNHIETTQL